jgi:hypothetical protein
MLLDSAMNDSISARISSGIDALANPAGWAADM